MRGHEHSWSRFTKRELMMQDIVKCKQCGAERRVSVGPNGRIYLRIPGRRR